MNAAIFNIINQMSQYLSAEQLRELQKVLIINLVEGKTEEVQHDYSYYVEMFISAKILEGKSRQSMDSYVNSINQNATVLRFCPYSKTMQLLNVLKLFGIIICVRHSLSLGKRHIVFSTFESWCFT